MNVFCLLEKKNNQIIPKPNQLRLVWSLHNIISTLLAKTTPVFIWNHCSSLQHLAFSFLPDGYWNTTLLGFALEPLPHAIYLWCYFLTTQSKSRQWSLSCSTPFVTQRIKQGFSYSAGTYLSLSPNTQAISSAILFLLQVLALPTAGALGSIKLSFSEKNFYSRNAFWNILSNLNTTQLL